MCASKVADGKERGWIIATASQLRATGPRYERLFGELGAARVTALDFDTRRGCEEASRLEAAAPDPAVPLAAGFVRDERGLRFVGEVAD